MIHELPRSRFGLAAPLFAEAWMDAAFIEAAFEGRVPARLFVNDAARPTAALLCRTFGYYVAGDPGATELRRFLADAPAEAGVFAELYGYVPTNVPLARAILDDYAGRLIVVARRGLRWEEGPAAEAALARWHGPPPDGITIRPIDRALAERIDRELGQLIGLFWGGYDRFLAGGFGFCAVRGDTLASVAYAAAASATEGNIDVFTAEAFRRRGLAARTCAAFIAHCRARGLVATWDCDADNPPSAALARSLGFREGHPHSQISTPGYARLAESRGRWRATPAAGGVVAWRRAET